MNGIKAFFVSLLFVVNFQLSAQVRNYTFNDTIGNYTAISGGTQHGSATVDDDSYTGISLGFTFVFNGQSHSKISINSNGYIALGSTIYETYNPISDPDGTPNIISALTYDIKGQSNGELRSQSMGTSPNKVFVVQWKNFKRYSFNSDSLDFQIRIYETSNKIELVYGRCALSGYTNGIDNLFEVGLRGDTEADFSNRKIGNSDTWITSKTGTNNSDRCRITSSITPPLGLSYSWENIVYQNDVSVNEIVTNSGCETSSADDISILIKNNGLQTQSNFLVGYKINNSSVVIDTFTQSLVSNSSTLFTFSQQADFSTYGSYQIKAWTSLSSDGFNDNDTFFGYSIYSAPTIDAYPYFENFESNDGYWHSGVLTSTDPWQWGAPAQTVIDSAYSGSKVWMTDLDANYPDNCQSFLQSPCFDFTDFAEPKISFYMQMETEGKWDPMILEASTNHGNSWTRVDSANTSFYNSTYTGGPFTPPYFSGNNSYWTKYTADLSAYGNESSVALRYRFLADGSTNDEGIAIDDVELFAANDISMLDLYLPEDSICGDTMQDVWVIIKNTGKNKIYNTPIRVKISGPISHTINNSKNLLNVNQVDTFYVGTFNSNAGGTYNFQCFSRYYGDNKRGNDTIVETRYIYPSVPQGGKLIPHLINHKTIFNAGTASDPDIGCLSDTSSYIFQLPTGMSWNDYDTLWSINNAIIETEFGRWPVLKVISDPASVKQMFFLVITTPFDADSLFRISFTLNLSNGCSREYEHYLKIGENINSDFSVNNECLGSASTFINQSTVSSGNLTYHWDFGNGDTSIANNPSNTYNSTGTFNAQLLATASSGCNSTFDTNTTIYEVPVVNFSIKDVCQYDTAYFINQTPTIQDTVNYFWDFGNGLTSYSFNASSVYDSGYYWVSLKGITNNSCSDSIAKMITAYPLPIVDFSFDDICLGDTLFVKDLSSDPWGNALTYNWSFDTYDTSSLSNPYFMPVSFGAFDIQLNAYSAQLCSTNRIKTVSINAVPKADFLYLMTHLCLGDTLKVMNNSSIASSDSLKFFWNYDLNDTSSAITPIAIPDTIGTFSMQLIVGSNKNCVDTIAKDIQVYQKPIADFSMDDKELCLGETILFTNSSTISGSDTLSYVWMFASTDTSALTNPNYTPKTDGNIDILLTTTSNHACWDTALQRAFIFALPDASFTNTLGSHGIVDFVPADTNLLSYLWYFGDGDSSSVKLAKHMYKIDGDYTVNLLVSSLESCMNEESSNINITGAGIANTDYLNDLKVYPNPFSNFIEIEFSLQKQTQLGIQLFDLNGKLIYTVADKSYNTGLFSERIELNELAAGYYFIRIKSAENQTIYKGVTKVE